MAAEDIRTALPQLLKLFLKQQEALRKFQSELLAVESFLAVQNKVKPSFLIQQFQKAATQQLAALPADSIHQQLQAMLDLLESGKDLTFPDS